MFIVSTYITSEHLLLGVCVYGVLLHSVTKKKITPNANFCIMLLSAQFIILSRDSAYIPVRFGDKNLSVRIRNRSCFGSKCNFWSAPGHVS